VVLSFGLEKVVDSCVSPFTLYMCTKSSFCHETGKGSWSNVSFRIDSYRYKDGGVLLVSEPERRPTSPKKKGPSFLFSTFEP